MEITLPHKFTPRPYQLPILRAMDSGYKRAIQVWHRKSGKEKTDWNILIKKSQERVGNYWYIFPKLTQARKVLWEGIDQVGLRFSDHVPKQILDGEPNNTSMFLRFKNGSTIQLIGGDTFDTSIGGNPVGIIFSEYSLTSPRVWTYLRPILANNGGWVIFNFTPRGENHAYDLYCLAKEDPKNWFCQLLTVDDTGAISRAVLDQEQREIIKLNGDDALYQQEYYCNFSVPIAGAYYAKQIMLAYQEGRVGNVPYDEQHPVDTWWDLGVDDYMTIWFSQSIGAEVRIIDYYENNGEGFPHYAQVLNDRGYVYKEHNAPHDIKVQEMGTGKTRIETAKSLGIKFRVVPKLPIMDGIDACRSMFRRCWFDKNKCELGLNALKNYHKKFDEDRKTYLNDPYHDWSSHGADGFRTMGVGLNYVKSVKTGTYVHKDSAEARTGWTGGNYVPEWAREAEPATWLR